MSCLELRNRRHDHIDIIYLFFSKLIIYFWIFLIYELRVCFHFIAIRTFNNSYTPFISATHFLVPQA